MAGVPQCVKTILDSVLLCNVHVQLRFFISVGSLAVCVSPSVMGHRSALVVPVALSS